MTNECESDKNSEINACRNAGRIESNRSVSPFFESFTLLECCTKNALYGNRVIKIPRYRRVDCI